MNGKYHQYFSSTFSVKNFLLDKVLACDCKFFFLSELPGYQNVAQVIGS